ncbi:MAG: alpha/beta hydrolase [Pseudomonadales bacterium]
MPAGTALTFSALLVFTSSTFVSSTLASSAYAAPASGADRELSPAGTTFELTACTLTGSRGIESIEAECGNLQRPENPEQPEGRQISLRVAVIRSPSPAPEPDAFTLINGGPGGSSISLYADSASAFAAILLHRDIVVVDQRGTGSSAPLRCAGLDDLTDGLVPGSIAVATKECLQSLPGEPGNYTTSAAVADLEAARAALGYARFNVYAVSYGTRVAQHFARRYPASVRTLILDGILPADVPLGPNAAFNAQQTLEQIFSRCAKDTHCAEAFPDLPATFAALQSRLRTAAVEITLPHPVQGTAHAMAIGYPHLLMVVRLLSYSPETAALIPLVIQEAQRDANFTPLAANALQLQSDLDNAIGVGMHNSVVCTEDVPFIGEVNWPALDATYMGADQVRALQTICQHWPAGPLDNDLRTPLVSDVPALLLSGEFDPITPPRYGDAVAAQLSNALHITAPGQGHGVFARGCLPRLMSEFVEQADWRALDTACVDRLQPTPFFINLMGPSP